MNTIILITTIVIGLVLIAFVMYRQSEMKQDMADMEERLINMKASQSRPVARVGVVVLGVVYWDWIDDIHYIHYVRTGSRVYLKGDKRKEGYTGMIPKGYYTVDKVEGFGINDKLIYLLREPMPIEVETTNKTT